MAKSELFYTGNLRFARDYLLWMFTQSSRVNRAEFKQKTRLASDIVDRMLSPLAILCTGSDSRGWEFKYPTDFEFISRYPAVVERQEMGWRERKAWIASNLVAVPDAKGKGKTSTGENGEHEITTTQHLLEKTIAELFQREKVWALSRIRRIVNEKLGGCPSSVIAHTNGYSCS